MRCCTRSPVRRNCDRTAPSTCSFACRCTKEKVEAALLGLGADELHKMARERTETEATCEFCKKMYVFTSEEVNELASRLEKA